MLFSLHLFLNNGMFRKMTKSKCPMFSGNSQNGKFSYGYASSPGKRSSMEDFYETRIDGVDGEIVGLFGVFDGMFLSFSLAHMHEHANNLTNYWFMYTSHEPIMGKYIL